MKDEEKGVGQVGMSRCDRPRATKKVHNPGTGPRAWCPGCKSWKPASQVPFGRELRNEDGLITATYAPVAHGKPAS